MKQKYNVLDSIIDYEDGNLNEEEVVVLFQHLVDNGLAWRLQGSYGRTANDLIRAGLVHLRKIRKDEPTPLTPFFDAPY